MAQTEKKKSPWRPVLPYYGAAAACLAYAWLLPLYRLSDVLLMGAVGCGAGALLWAVCRDPEEKAPAAPGRGPRPGAGGGKG